MVDYTKVAWRTREQLTFREREALFLVGMAAGLGVTEPAMDHVPGISALYEIGYDPNLRLLRLFTWPDTQEVSYKEVLEFLINKVKEQTHDNV